jgi:hypothetical protein
VLDGQLLQANGRSDRGLLLLTAFQVKTVDSANKKKQALEMPTTCPFEPR